MPYTREYLKSLPPIQSWQFTTPGLIHKKLVAFKNANKIQRTYTIQETELIELKELLLDNILNKVPDNLESDVEVKNSVLYVLDELRDFEFFFVNQYKLKDFENVATTTLLRLYAHQKKLKVHGIRNRLFPRRRIKGVETKNPIYAHQHGGKKKNTKKLKNAAKKNEKVHTGPKGGKFVVRNGKNVYV